MKGFKNSTKIAQGHHFAAGGHVGHFARQSTPALKPANGDTVTGLTARTPVKEASTLVKRSVPSVDADKSPTGGRSPLLPGYKQGGQTGKPMKAFHVHNHYHNGKKMPGKKALAKIQAKAEGGLIGPKASPGTHKTSVQHETPEHSGFKKGGKVGKATGGTINCMNAGGALYGKGGRTK